LLVLTAVGYWRHLRSVRLFDGSRRFKLWVTLIVRQCLWLCLSVCLSTGQLVLAANHRLAVASSREPCHLVGLSVSLFVMSNADA